MTRPAFSRNRYILECKVFQCFLSAGSHSVEIDTFWNVKAGRGGVVRGARA